MKSYSFFVSFRYVMMLLALIFFVNKGIPGERLSAIFSVAEFFLLIILVTYSFRLFSFAHFDHFTQWMRKHISFGLRFFVGGVTSEFNTRIDVLILGYFTSVWHVGIYSFAAIIVEGLNQIPYVLKQNIDPVLTKMISQGQFGEIITMVEKGRKWTFFGMATISFVLALVYPLCVRLFVGNDDFMNGWPVLCILIVGSVIQASYTPFSGMLVQGGFPGTQTLLFLLVAISNISLNVIMVPLFGINGAAVATAISFGLFVYYFKKLTLMAFKITI